MTIERIGTWRKYHLVVDGKDLGEIKRTMIGGGDRMQPRTRYVAWTAPGRTVETKEEAERALIAHAARFGYLETGR